MRKSVGIGITAILLGLCACSTVKQAPAAGERTSWDPAALRTLERLSDKLRAAGIKCEGYFVPAIELYDKDYLKRVPIIPAGVGACDTHGDEDLTFEAFETAPRAQNFIQAKLKLLCRSARVNKIEGFPGFPYVDGGTWLVEPDEKETGDEIAPILGGQSKMASCDSVPTPIP